MSRRPPNPSAERNAQNQATLKSLLKLEPNKVCADCKRNKHPRWASWNLGVFVCIRCSGIHRGMGTHISRVKSVDLDSWTDEQMQSILSWGNGRANKYWEAKLAAGHAPSESKIENFIRTKYELKRWVMDGPMPDPSTLDAEGDDDVPLSVVKEKQSIQRKESVRKASIGQQNASRSIPAPEADLIGGDDPVPARSSTTGPPASSRVPPKAGAAPPKATSTKDSLLGLDFLGGGSAPPSRPSSTTGVSSPGAQSRPDLKQSILSLYASAPRPQAQPQQGNQQSGSFGSMTSPTGHQQQGSMGGFNDAFGNLSMSGTTSPPPPADPFASLGSGSRRTSQAPKNPSFSNLSGGSFFDTKPAPSPPPPQQKQPSPPNFEAFGSFTSPSPGPAPTQTKPTQPASSAMGDLFDLSAPVTQSTPPPAAFRQPSPPSAGNNNMMNSSVFNLSSQQNQPTTPAAAPAAGTASSNTFSAMSGADVWGSNEWTGAASPAPPAAAPVQKSPELPKQPANDFGWGSTGSLANTPIVPGAGGGLTTAPKVSADEEFGGWASSTGGTNANAVPKGSGGFGGDEDLFSNVWQ